MAVRHSHKALMQSSLGSENEDDVPPSMHESLREEVASSSDDESSSDGGSKRPLRDDALPGYSVKDASNDVEEDEELLLDKSASDQRGQKLKNGGRKTRKSRGHTRNAASSNMTGEELKLKLEQSNLRKLRRRSSAAKSERLFLGLQPRTALFLLLPIAGVLLVLTLLFGRHYYSSEDLHAGLLSNGTNWFNNTVLLVSFDGFKPAYLTRELTPHLVQVSEKGLRAEYLRSIFPTLTFPNLGADHAVYSHWAIQTGLYAESHGIVGNDSWDPTDNTEFYFTHDDTSKDPKWWLGEPMWETVVRNGLKSASIMWPGPPITRSGISPTYHRPFQNHVGWAEKKDQIATWLDLPDSQRPQFICAYLPEIDQQGHSYGPDSDEVNVTLREMDKFSEALHAVLAERNLLDIVNVIYVSDHGMTETANERVVYLDEVLGEDGFAAIEHKEGWPSCGLRFKAGTNETLMVERIEKGVKDSNGGFKYYTHETMPEEFHFRNSPRIAPHFLVPEVGWAISDKTQGWYEAKGRYTPYGNHGYDRDHEDMHAIFVAHGPFAERIKSTKKKRETVPHRLPSQDKSHDGITVIPGFDNLEIYTLITRELLNLSNVAPNNGTVGFWEKFLQ